MEGLELLGAADALADQYLVVRIKRIDRDRLKQKLGGSTGSIASSALTFVDMAPKAAVDLALPFVKTTAKDYGIDVEIVPSNVPPSKGGRAISEFFPGLIVGTVIGGASLAIVKGLQALLGR